MIRFKIKRPMLTGLALAIATGLSGCAVFYPEVADKQPRHCDLVTRNLDLEVEVYKEVPTARCADDACVAYLAVLAVVPVGSFIVSGTIVVVGDTLHWLEKEGRCDDGLVQTAWSNFTDWIDTQPDPKIIKVPSEMPGDEAGRFTSQQ